MYRIYTYKILNQRNYTKPNIPNNVEKFWRTKFEKKFGKNVASTKSENKFQREKFNKKQLEKKKKQMHFEGSI